MVRSSKKNVEKIKRDKLEEIRDKKGTRVHIGDWILVHRNCISDYIDSLYYLRDDFFCEQVKKIVRFADCKGAYTHQYYTFYQSHQIEKITKDVSKHEGILMSRKLEKCRKSYTKKELI